MTEWEFTSAAASWINDVIRRTPDSKFSEMRCEQRGKGSQKRRDLTLLDRDKRAVLTGEVKLPYQKDGNSPHNASVVRDARSKAQQERVKYFFTWNVNEFLLWPTETRGDLWEDRIYKGWRIAAVRSDADLMRASLETGVRRWADEFLREFTQIHAGDLFIGHKAPDEKFIEMLESSLNLPILHTFDELETRYQTARFKTDLDHWMTREQNWVIVDDDEGVRDNLERAAKFACYSLVNKLVFHEALLKNYGSDLYKLTVPRQVTTGAELRTRIESYFDNAKSVTGDYETVFGEDHTTIGNRIPFYSDQAVSHWRELIAEIHQYDFTALKHDIIGPIFERLLGEDERKKYGQFYTRPEVVDLINSFCIRTGLEKVMDPACGSGTFLVRAYGRKKELAPRRSHTDLLTDLYGVDIARYATEWTTINLATRDLVNENYPRVTRKDFFDVDPHKPFIRLPDHRKKKRSEKVEHWDVTLPELDAVIGNLPYVRQEQIDKIKKGAKDQYRKLAEAEGRIKFSGRSDIHVYFWPHAAVFLKPDGQFCFLTSSQWLDVEYGFRLQEWILRNFELVAVFESIDEPWFVGARVATTITILKRQPDESKRRNNIVRFVQLRRPIGEILAYDGTMAGAVTVANAFHDEILALTENSTNERYRARLVRQGNLWDAGVELGRAMNSSDEEEDSESVAAADYLGGKWGVYLRAPDFWFDLMEETGDRWSHLGAITEIKYGIKSGADDFFYVRDVTDDFLSVHTSPTSFREATGYARKVFESGKVRLVRCGKGYEVFKVIEAEYLQPEIHSLMEIEGYSVAPEDCTRQVLMVSEPRGKLKNTHVLDYIKWGESQNFHKNKTCASRVTETREWYDITGHAPAPVLWPKERQYRHIAPANPNRLVANCRLYEIYPPDNLDDPDLWGAILNSTWVLLSSLQFGRPMGNEGNWSTMVVDANMMLVPDPTHATPKQVERVKAAFQQLKTRPALQFLSEKRLRLMAYRQARKEEHLANLSDNSELTRSDRRALDDAVLEFVGVSSTTRRGALIDSLYTHLGEFFELLRQKEEKAIANKNQTSRKGAARPDEIAIQIHESMKISHPEFLRTYEGGFLNGNDADVFEVPMEGEPRVESDIMGSAVSFTKGKTKRLIRIETSNPAQSELLALVVSSGLRGFIRVPHQEKECRKILKAYEPFVAERDKTIRQLVEDRTADEDLQQKIYDALMPMILRGD